MYYLMMRQRLTITILLLSLALLSALTVRAPSSSARAPGKPALRLRLRLQTNTLRPGDATKLFVEFLDRDYQQVTNDGTRVVELSVAPPNEKQTGSAYISPRLITVRPGVLAAEATLTSRQPGRLVITARSAGLDPAQTLVLISPQKASFLSQLFETVAYAETPAGLAFYPDQFPAPLAADNKYRATFQVASSEAPPTFSSVRISTDLNGVGIAHSGQVVGTSIANIPLDPVTGISKEIGIFSGTPGKVTVRASLPHSAPVNLEITFATPQPSKVMLNGPETISSDSTVPISIELVDAGGLVLMNEQERRIRLRSLNDEDKDSITFEPEEFIFPTNRRSVQAFLHLHCFPQGNELRLAAEAEGETQLESVSKSIFLKSPIERLVITGPKEINPGETAEFTVHLANKDGNPRIADWPRKLSLGIQSIDAGVGTGVLTPTHVKIEKGSDHAVVKYQSPNKVGRFILTATGAGLENCKHEIRSITALHWLVMIALFGGAIGGCTRQLHLDYKRKRNLKKRSRRSLTFVLQRIAGSIVSGLFLYLTIKLGLAQLFGLISLPAALDPDSKLVAFFFAGLGGFAGLVVMHRLVGKLFKPSQTQKESPAHAGFAAKGSGSATAIKPPTM